MLVFGLSVAFSVNVTMFSTLRFFEGFCLAGLALSLYVLSKYMLSPPRARLLFYLCFLTPLFPHSWSVFYCETYLFCLCPTSSHSNPSKLTRNPNNLSFNFVLWCLTFPTWSPTSTLFCFVKCLFLWINVSSFQYLVTHLASGANWCFFVREHKGWFVFPRHLNHCRLQYISLVARKMFWDCTFL